jgi:hypothetical protein
MKKRISFAWWVAILASAITLASSALAQTNTDPDLVQPGRVVNLSPIAKVLRPTLWALGGVLFLIAAVVIVYRHRVNPTLYSTVADAHWQDDSVEEKGSQLDENQVQEAVIDFLEPAPTGDGAPSEPDRDVHSRLYTPATGPAWREPKLNAYLSACLKANCLGRAWQEEAARRQPNQPASRRVADPREAEFIRKLKARWQELHVDPEFGIFVDRVAAGSDRSRLCLIQVSREKHAITSAALNAGFVIESVGRYLKGSDVVHPTEPGFFHAPNQQELTALSDEEKKRVLRLKNIPEPWEAMIA